MARKEPLNPMDGLEAAELLHETFTRNPKAFSAAFKKAAATPTLSLEGGTTTVAALWTEAHAVGLSEQPTAAATVAKAILGNGSAMAQLKKSSSKMWFILIEALFPYFDLPRGWLAIAEQGGLLPGHIRTFIMNRVRAIDSPQTAKRERAFIRMLLSRPPRPSLGYRTVLDADDRNKVLEIAGQYLPDELTHNQADTMAWRHSIG